MPVQAVPPVTQAESSSASLESQLAGAACTGSGTFVPTSSPTVYISQAPFVQSAVNFQSSSSQSPSISTSHIQCSTSGMPSASYQTGQGSSTSGNLQATTHSALSSLITQVLAGARSNTIDPNHLFWILTVSGNISRCQGCAGKILRAADGKPLPPPVLQHKEQVLFQNPKTGTFQLSHDFRNVYYHALHYEEISFLPT